LYRLKSAAAGKTALWIDLSAILLQHFYDMLCKIVVDFVIVSSSTPDKNTTHLF
jgi:hypothetical protein